MLVYTQVKTVVGSILQEYAMWSRGHVGCPGLQDRSSLLGPRSEHRKKVQGREDSPLHVHMLRRGLDKNTSAKVMSDLC